jgi:hypothetical protein
MRDYGEIMTLRELLDVVAYYYSGTFPRRV